MDKEDDHLDDELENFDFDDELLDDDFDDDFDDDEIFQDKVPAEKDEEKKSNIADPGTMPIIAVINIKTIAKYIDASE